MSLCGDRRRNRNRKSVIRGLTPSAEQETTQRLDSRQRSTSDIPQGRRRRENPCVGHGIQRFTADFALTALTSRPSTSAIHARMPRQRRVGMPSGLVTTSSDNDCSTRVPSATATTAADAYGFDLNCRLEEHKGEYGGRLRPS